MSKREGEAGSSSALVKRAKSDDGPQQGQAQTKAIVRSSEGAIVTMQRQRTSDLLAPTMKLSGHASAVTGLTFAPGGAALASCSSDGTLLLWNTLGEIAAYERIAAHKKAALSVQWSGDGAYVLTASVDQTVCVWDSETSERLKRTREHTGAVSDVASAVAEPSLFASASDDGSCRLWDVRQSASTACMTSPYQVLSCALSKDASFVYWAGVDDVIHMFDARRMDEPLVLLAGHRDSVTSLSLSADNSYLLSNGRDNTVRIWDAKPFSQRANRCVKIFLGALHDQDTLLLRAAWSPDGALVASGSADRCVYAWDTTTKQIAYKLPGHKGAVNAVAFHPSQPILASAGSDKIVYLGELGAADAAAE